MNKPQAGHWVLAALGKKVLRPGGRETTNFLLNHSPITGARVVEFAPGLGITAAEILSRTPSSYVGVDADPSACETTRRRLDELQPPCQVSVRECPADATGLEDGSADVVVGEAMLSMQTDAHKLAIMREAARILRTGGIYAIHELLLTPAELDEESKTAIQRDLARAIKVNARPLTIDEWSDLATQAGFEVVKTFTTSMSLLEPRRLIADEGFGVFKIAFNLLRQPQLRKRVVTMRATFSKHAEHLGAIGLVLKKSDVS